MNINQEGFSDYDKAELLEALDRQIELLEALEAPDTGWRYLPTFCIARHFKELERSKAELLEALKAMLDAHKFNIVHCDQPRLIEANRKARAAIDNALRDG